MPIAAGIAITVATTEDTEATISEFFAARRMSGLFSTTPYQRMLKPPQIVAVLPALKASTSSTTIGR